MEKIEVKYLNVVIGYTCDGGKTIEFLDNEESKEVQNSLLKGHTVGISSRRMGTIDENGYVSYEKITEYGILNYLDKLIEPEKKQSHMNFNNLTDKEKELYSEIEYLIIMWNNDGTKTAGELTRQIMELLTKQKNTQSGKCKICGLEKELIYNGKYCQNCL